MSAASLHQAGLLSASNRILVFPNLINADMHKCILMHTINILKQPDFLEHPENYGYTGNLTRFDVTDKLSMQVQKDVGTKILISAYMESTHSAFRI